MKNFPITAINPDTGLEETFWHSRSVAVVGFVFLRAAPVNKIWVLANQRGEGTPDFQGMWNCPCGYLDFNETAEKAVAREILEETGLNFEPDFFNFEGVSTDPSDNRQNVTLRFTLVLNGFPSDFPLNSIHSEENEVQNLAWVPLSELDSHEWAFGHKQLIEKYAPPMVRLYTLSVALQAIQEGYFVKRQCWPSTTLFFQEGTETTRPCIMARIWNGTVGPWTATHEDILATDWMIIQ